MTAKGAARPSGRRALRRALVRDALQPLPDDGPAFDLAPDPHDARLAPEPALRQVRDTGAETSAAQQRGQAEGQHVEREERVRPPVDRELLAVEVDRGA